MVDYVKLGKEMEAAGFSAEPCGCCRRCAIHDDPGGCLEVEKNEREYLAHVEKVKTWRDLGGGN